MAKIRDSKEQSIRMKTEHANKMFLKGLPREIYLAEIAKVGNCQKVARMGNRGSGYRMPYYGNNEMTEIVNP